MPGFRIQDAAGDEKSVDLGSKDIKRAHRWRITQFGPVTDQNDLLFAKSVTMPNIGFDEYEILGASIAYKVATKPKFDDLIIAFYDVEQLEPKIRIWQSKVWSPTDGIGLAADYKDKVELYLTDGEGNPVDAAWSFINAWPKSINHGELLYDSSDFKLVTVTISYDWIEYPPIGAAFRTARSISNVGKTASQLVENAAQSALNGIRSFG